MLGDAWGVAIDIAAVFLGVGIMFLGGALISNRIAQHFGDATASDFIRVTARYVQMASYHAFVTGLVVAVVSLVFIAVSRFMAHWGSQQ